MSDPAERWQKSVYCWQMENQFAEEFPLCAKYTMAAAAEAPDVRRTNIIFKSFKCQTYNRYQYYSIALAIHGENRVHFCKRTFILPGHLKYHLSIISGAT